MAMKPCTLKKQVPRGSNGIPWNHGVQLQKAPEECYHGHLHPEAAYYRNVCHLQDS